MAIMDLGYSGLTPRGKVKIKVKVRYSVWCQLELAADRNRVMTGL